MTSTVTTPAPALADLEARIARLEGHGPTALLATLARLEHDLAAAHAENARLAKAATLRDAAQRQAMAACENRLIALQQTITWQAGELALYIWCNPLRLWRLPGGIMALRRQARQRRNPGQSGGADIAPTALAELVRLHSQGGLEAARLWLEAWSDSPAARAGGLAALTRSLMAVDLAAALAAARLAYAVHPVPSRAKWLAFRLYDGGVISEAAELLDSLPADTALSPGEAVRAAQIHGAVRVQTPRPAAPARTAPEYRAAPGSMLYVSASSMPFHHSGYALRSQALLQALRRQGVALTVATRPGYPWDRRDRQGEPLATSEIDGITYHHTPAPDQSQPLDTYIGQAAGALAAVARTARVAVIHAASNHVNALPALRAARMLGVPFHYEMRGLWELSRASKLPGYEASERFRLGLALEAQVARAADRVFVLSQPFADRIVADWGLDPARITLLPNGIDPALFSAIAARPPARFTIGYAGALVPYEGLDLLVDAIARLREQGIIIHAELWGRGEALPALQAQVRRLGLTEQVRLPGSVSQQDAYRRLAQCSLVCLPRRPSQVCELVPPLKLVEAMALGVPVLVPDLPVFRSEAEPDRTALFFTAGDADDLVRALADAVADPRHGAAIAARARSEVLANRSWDSYARRITEPASVACRAAA